MKKIYLSSLLFFFLTLSMNAQKTIAVLTGSNWTFYTDFSTALNQCATGSTIYLPGGTFILSQNVDTINKSVSIIGVGHHPDSTLATSPSVLQGDLKFGNGGDNSTIVGVYITGSINISNGTQNVSNINIIRCRVGGGIYPGNFYNVNIDECVVLNNINSYSNVSNNIIVQRSIILGNIYDLNGATFNNNILYGVAGNGVTNHCVFKNNVILNSVGIYTYQSIFSNNLIFGTESTTQGNTNISNYINGNYVSTFINCASANYSYNNDYHLLSTSVGKNSGTDGTDIGIYGTAYPYKPSAVPANPHISFKSISPSSAPNGTLPVNIRVIAQDK